MIPENNQVTPTNNIIPDEFKNYTSGTCHRASWGSVVRCKTRDCIEIITITAVLFD